MTIAASISSDKSATPAHTPGPWHVNPEGSKRDVIAGGVDPRRARLVADCRTHATANTAEEQANARLIAAAPDMLQALREVAGNCYVLEHPGDTVACCGVCWEPEGEPHDHDCTMQFVLAAIAKVEGR